MNEERKKIVTAFKAFEQSGSPRSAGFIASLRKYYQKNKTLSGRQQIALYEIVANLGVE